MPSNSLIKLLGLVGGTLSNGGQSWDHSVIEMGSQPIDVAFIIKVPPTSLVVQSVVAQCAMSIKD